MYISPNDVESALLRIYTELQIPCGTALSHSYLLKRWRENRLRHSDLDSTLSRMIRSRQMDAKDTFEGRAFLLTELGQRRAAALHAGRVKSVLNRVRLSFAQLLRPAEALHGEGSQQRRLIDRHAPRI